MDRPRRLNPSRAPRRGRGNLLTIIVALVVALLVIGPLGGLYVDWLWFESVGLQSVYATRLTAQIILFLVGALAFFAVFVANAAVTRRLAGRDDVFVQIVRPGGGNRSLWAVLLAVGLFLSIISGLAQAGSWDVVLRFQNPAAFGVVDPLFGQDVSFFVFTLPVYELLQGWFMSAVLLSLLASVAVYFVRFVLPQLPRGDALDTQVTQLRLDFAFGPGIKAHLLVLVALLALGFVWRYVLDIYGLVFSRDGLVFGAGYADVNARWPAMWAMIAAALLFAVLAVVSIRRRGYGLPLVGLVLWLGVWIVGAGIYPGIVQRFQVQPSELDKERPFLESNIALTNRAYGLDRITEVDFPAEEALTPQDIAANPTTINNIRLLDPDPLLDTYNQIQSIRAYYDFIDVDVDRYTLDGEYRQVMLSARELSPSQLGGQAQTWVNRRLQFTHGYGLAMSAVNEVTSEGLPQLLMRDVPPQGKLPVQRPEIYYGENTSDFVIVNTASPEFDYPRGDDNVYVQYQGQTGVPVGSVLRRLLFAWQFEDVNILLAGAITPESRILFNRNIVDRAQRVAPFLRFDRDPYLVVAAGRLYWMLDAYTSTSHYPYAQPINLTSRDTVNYLRNSVKVVIDAYDGAMRFYMADATDPLIRSYSGIFPGLLLPLDQMPPELRSHVRYPEDMFRIQAELYRTYHMKDARVFYNKEDIWNVASEIRADNPTPMMPYYVIMRLPGEQREEFTLILPFTPPNKNNMITWLAARSDGEAYGTLLAYRYPKDKLIYGPMQIEARIDQDPFISQQLTLWNQSGSQVIRGDLIVIPIASSNLYVEPIYLQSEQTKLPEMKRVVVATGNRVAMEPTATEAIARLFAGQAAPAQPAAPPAQASPPSQGLSEEARALLDRLNKLQDEIKQISDEVQRMLGTPGGQ